MTLFKLDRSDVDKFTVITNPIRTYLSSSTEGVTGSVYVFSRRSPSIKDVTSGSAFVDGRLDDSGISSTLSNLQQVGLSLREGLRPELTSSFTGMVSAYLNKVDASAQSRRELTATGIERFVPGTVLDETMLRKSFVRQQLSSYYRPVYLSANWAYTNYHCLNFFTSSTVPTSSCLLYPNVVGDRLHEGYVSGTYVPSGAFSIEFYVNPCRREQNVQSGFKAATLLHLSSTFAVSIVSGSSQDENQRPSTFRVQLQLSHSADIPPSLLVASGANRATHRSGSSLTNSLPGYATSDLGFLSDDGSLIYNHWHHVVIRWGTSAINSGTGSFVIDGIERGTFVVPSSTIAPRTFGAGGNSSPDVLVVGNYFEGLNHGTGSLSSFFAADTALREGLEELDGSSGINEPTPSRYSFRHPGNFQVHDVSIRQRYQSDLDLATSSSLGPKSIDPDVCFYLPPFYVESSPYRQFVTDHGGVMQTPFLEVDGTTADPFNVAMSFGVGGHYINLENFVRDFAGNVFPRLHHLSASVIAGTTSARTANQFLYDQPFVRYRNLLIMPCDDGNFVPGYELLASESLNRSMVDDLDVQEFSLINVDQLLSTGSLIFGSDFGEDTTFSDEVIGFTPENPNRAPGRAFLGFQSSASGSSDPGIQEGAPLAIYQRTRDASSNQVTFFSVSDLLYGKRIMPGSVVITDKYVSGSGGAVGITLKDDGRGTLYRADCLTSASTWNSVGTVFYDEGILVIKSPHLYFFGADQYQFDLRGERSIHVMTVNALAPANQLNSSSNPNYLKLAPSAETNDPDDRFTYISGINLHDRDLNVVAKAQLAQPVMKRPGTRIMFRLKIDH